MPERLPFAYIAFSEEPTRFTPGRIRLRIPEERHNTEFLSRLVDAVSGIAGVLEASARPHTGSLLIVYDGAGDEIINRLSVLGLIQLGSRENAPHAWPEFTSEERAIVEGGVYLMLSLVQVYRGKALGAGSSLLGHAMESIRQIGLQKQLADQENSRPSVLATLANLK